MKLSTLPCNSKAGWNLSARFIIFFLFLGFATSALAQSYSGPLVITKGGTYRGNWESRNSEEAAVEIRTSEPVIIENSNIRGAGYLIKSWGYSANLTVRHTKGYGLTPTPYSNYKKPRRFITLNNFQNLVVENCYLESTAGIYAGTRYEGDGSTKETIRIRYNVVKNIDGRVYGGAKEHSQFVQFNFKGAIRNAEIAWNEVMNEADKSLVEDNINIYNTRGTKDSPIRIHNNYIQGAFPFSANGTQYSGGGIITDGDAGINDCPAFIEAFENHLVGLGNYSMGIAGGNNIRYHHNRAINAATFSNGSKYNMYTSGLWSKDYYHLNTTFANFIDNNVVGIVAWGYKDNRNDVSVAQNADFRNNTHLPNPITVQSEKDELSRWQQKLQQNNVKLGPGGSGTTAPANQQPKISFTSPSDNAAFVLGTIIPLVANATDADGSIAKVEFYLGTSKIGEALRAPYVFNWSKATAGTHRLTAKAFDNQGASAQSAAINVQVSVQTSIATPTLPQTSGVTGSITREFWAGVHSADMNKIPVTSTPNSQTTLSSFEAPSNVGDNYGQRIRGYVTAPVSGQYTFWIASDDKAELYLSTSEEAGAKRRIAFVDSWTNSREWDKHASQQSARVSLEAGKRYYIEALHLEGGGGDNLAVGWQLPSGAMERPIAGNRLSPMGTVNATPTPVTPLTNITYATGKLQHEVWYGVHSHSVRDIPVGKAPNKTGQLSSFEAPSNVGDNYGQRIRGYVTAPVSGQYTFWIASDDKAELYLSTSEEAGAKRRIAFVESWTNSREWDKHASQQSARVSLEAGKRYYIEALHLEGGGGDNLAVGWQLPSGALERPIAGNRLSAPADGFAAMQIAGGGGQPEPFFEAATAYPNPFQDVVTVSFGAEEVKVAQVAIFGQDGRALHTLQHPRTEGNKLELNLEALNLRPGLYILKYTDTEGKSNTLKLIKQ